MSKILLPGLLLSAAVVIPATTRAAEPQPVGAPRLLVTDRDSGLPVSGAVVRGGGKIWSSDETGLLVLSENALHGDSLTVSAVGYADRRVSTVEVRSHRPLRVAAHLVGGDVAVDITHRTHGETVAVEGIFVEEEQTGLVRAPDVSAVAHHGARNGETGVAIGDEQARCADGLRFGGA